MTSPELPEDTAAAPVGGPVDSGLPNVRARVRVYRPRRYRARAFVCGFVCAAVLVAGVVQLWWQR